MTSIDFEYKMENFLIIGCRGGHSVVQLVVYRENGHF